MESIEFTNIEDKSKFKLNLDMKTDQILISYGRGTFSGKLVDPNIYKMSDNSKNIFYKDHETAMKYTVKSKISHLISIKDIGVAGAYITIYENKFVEFMTCGSGVPIISWYIGRFLNPF